MRDRAAVQLGRPGRIRRDAAVLAPVVDQRQDQADAAALGLPDRLVEAAQTLLAEPFRGAAPDGRGVLRVVEAPDARHRQRQADQIVQDLAHRVQRLRVLLLLGVRQQLLQVVEVRPRRAEGGHAVQQQLPVLAADEARDGRQRRAPGRQQLLGAQARRARASAARPHRRRPAASGRQRPARPEVERRRATSGAASEQSPPQDHGRHREIDDEAARRRPAWRRTGPTRWRGRTPAAAG